MGDGFVKLYGDRLLDSTLWLEAPEVRLVFLSMLAVADQGGVIDVPGIRALARKLNLTVEYLEPALEKLMEPDPDSRSEAHEGRRVRKRGRPVVGWQCVNYETYREFRGKKVELARLRQAKKRERDAVRDERDSNASHATSPLEADLDTENRTVVVADRRGDDGKIAHPEPVANKAPSSPSKPRRPTRTEESVRQVFAAGATGCHQRRGHLAVGMLFPLVAHREEFQIIAANCSELGEEWPAFLQWWWRPGGWASDNVGVATPKALLKGWARNVEEWRDPAAFAAARAARAQSGERPQDPRMSGDAYKELPR